MSENSTTNAVRQQLLALTHRGLVALLRDLGNGRVGTDPARATKEQLADHALQNYGLVRVVNALISTSPSSTPPSGASADNQPLPPKDESPTHTAPKEEASSMNGTTAPPDTATELARLIGELASGAKAPVDETAVKRIADASAQTAAAEILSAALAAITELRADMEKDAAQRSVREIIVKTAADAAGVKVSGQHPLFEKVLRLASAGVNVLLVGPAGCGKTHLCEQVAKALGRRFGALSLTAGTTESALVGRLLPGGENGTFKYYASPFVHAYEGGGVFLFDELDAADPNMLLIVNSALANGHIEIEQRAVNGLETRIERHAETLLLGAANTFGTGASAQYVGRGALDAATVDRWYVVKMDYDPAFEAGLYGGTAPAQQAWTAAGLDEATVRREITALGTWVRELRENASSRNLKRVVSSRMIQKAVLARQAGVPVDEIKRDLLAGWSADELSAVGES